MRRIRGEGNAALSNVTISRTPLVERLTRRTRVSFQNRQFETANTAGFVIGDNRITTRRIDFKSEGISMRVAGSYGFDGTIDADLQIGFIKSLLDNLGGGVPIVGNIIGELAGVVDQVTGALLLGFRVRGTAANPQVDPVPLPVLDRLQ